jgi:NADH:ubiquinone oxidoreductase subunit 3 (subunit A)
VFCLFIFLGIAFGIVPMLIGYWLGPSKPDEEKNSQFECGFPPFVVVKYATNILPSKTH